MINSNSDEESDKTPKLSKGIPLKDEIFMSDLEKYYKYGKIPYLFLFQLILVTLTTAVVNIVLIIR